MDLAPVEIVARIQLATRDFLSWNPVVSAFSRKTETWSDYYREVGTRRAQAISKVCFAGSILMDGEQVKDVRIALGRVAPTAVRATRTEDALRGKKLDETTIAAAERSLATEIAPIDDIRSTARYRGRVAANLLREFLELSN